MDETPAARVAILSGAGRHFCAGIDFELMNELLVEVKACVSQAGATALLLSDDPIQRLRLTVQIPKRHPALIAQTFDQFGRRHVGGQRQGAVRLGGPGLRVGAVKLPDLCAFQHPFPRLQPGRCGLNPAGQSAV